MKQELYENHYMGLFDLENDLVFVEVQNSDIHVDQKYFLPGNYDNPKGGTLDECITFLEQTVNISIDQSKIKYICSFDQMRPFEIQGEKFAGKRINNYFYAISKDECSKSFDATKYKWVKTGELFKDKRQFTSGVFNNFLNNQAVNY